ncbi:uncharacterized protein LOC135131881 isoform X2 [Zophobas morio]
MEDNTKLSCPEEDEDLEALRLAALQSLKRKATNEAQAVVHFGAKEKMYYFNGSPRGKLKRGKFPRSPQGRIPRNGQFNGWNRNSNLIAVPMITETNSPLEHKSDDVPKLVLPQDRYCKVEKSPEKPDTLTSKFDRYDNSDDSGSDSEDELSKSEPEEKTDLKRSSSLEALMAELENEIQGVSTKPEDKPKHVPKKKRKVSETNTAPASPEKPPELKPLPVLKENLKPDPELPKKAPHNFRQRKWQKPPRRHNVQSFGPPVVHHQVPPPEMMQPPVVAFAPPPVQTFGPFNPIGFDNGVYAPPPVLFEAPPPQLPPMHVAPPVYERPLSPLSISNITLAPLSPRSAAFVMENRAIVEKRKRRSYSRSPSPARFRRSKTPKRSSLSPQRLSKSPKRRSLSTSPIRKVLPPRTNSPKKPPIHDRLGVKPPTKTEPEDDKTKKNEEKKEVLDPILEARRKKFERNEIVMTEGVIRLKKQEDSEEAEPQKEEAPIEEQIEEEDDEDIDEEALLEGDDGDDAILLDHNALFSDEESDSDNEGRFKTKQESNQKVPVLSFTKLINGVKTEVKNDLRVEEKKIGRRNERRKNFRSRTPVKSPVKKAAVSKAPKKTEKVKQPIGFASDRKIEIKIRNPAKYERAEPVKSGEEKSGRKVEVAKKEGEEVEPETAPEGAEEVANSNISEGDLRAQLSRKRAERQKHPLPDVVPSRLLQNALQGVGFRKAKKSKNKDENAEGKLPIHLRLGAANNPEVFGKKSRKHKNKGSQEQV